MEWNIESIIFYLLLIDALGANILAFTAGQKWWQKHLSLIARYFPLSKGWPILYITLVLFIGYILYKTDLLITFW